MCLFPSCKCENLEARVIIFIFVPWVPKSVQHIVGAEWLCVWPKLLKHCYKNESSIQSLKIASTTICGTLNTFYFQALAPSLKGSSHLQKKTKQDTHTYGAGTLFLELEEHCSSTSEGKKFARVTQTQRTWIRTKARIFQLLCSHSFLNKCTASSVQHRENWVLDFNQQLRYINRINNDRIWKWFKVEREINTENWIMNQD